MGRMITRLAPWHLVPGAAGTPRCHLPWLGLLLGGFLGVHYGNTLAPAAIGAFLGYLWGLAAAQVVPALTLQPAWTTADPPASAGLTPFLSHPQPPSTPGS